MGAGHSHGHGGPWLDFPLDRAGRLLAALVAVTVAFCTVGIIVLWPTEEREIPPVLVGTDVDRVDATVDTVEAVPCIGVTDGSVRCVEITFSLGDGRTGSFQQTPSVTTISLEPGDRIVVADQGTDVDSRFRYFFLEFERDLSLVLLFVLFAGAVILLGRLQGVRSLVALFLSFGLLVVFTLPALLESDAPVLVAIVGSGAVAAITLFLTHGVNHLSAVSLVGSLVSLGITGSLAWIFVQATSLTGLSDEDALFLVSGDSSVDLRGLLLAGIIIGTVGVLDDVTVTQAAAVAEIHAADPSFGPARLYRSALRVGRDHIGSTTNTLVFAYAGAALPLLLLFSQAQLDLKVVVTSEIVAIEIVRALVGGIGLVASVPVTTALAAWVVGGSRTPTARHGSGHAHGHHRHGHAAAGRSDTPDHDHDHGVEGHEHGVEGHEHGVEDPHGVDDHDVDDRVEHHRDERHGDEGGDDDRSVEPGAPSGRRAPTPPVRSTDPEPPESWAPDDEAWDRWRRDER